jgi:hypothetical protein
MISLFSVAEFRNGSIIHHAGQRDFPPDDILDKLKHSRLGMGEG